jgi:hypothetical protein
MKSVAVVGVLCGALIAGAGVEGADGAHPPHDKAFWLAIAHDDYKVPEGESADVLVLELNAYLGSPDSELRDDCAYSIAAAWIYRDKRLAPETLRSLLATWTGNFRNGLGETGADTLLLRSFSALDLSTLAALDNVAPFLTEGEFASMLSATLDYLAGEKDLRGFDSQRGWMHATAHTADVLKFLGRSGRLEPADQRRILAAIGAKLRSAGLVFVWGENERLGRAVESLVLRPDFDRGAFAAWLAAIQDDGKRLWENGPAIDPGRFPGVQNAKVLLLSLYAGLALRGSAHPEVEPARVEILRCIDALG